MFRNYTRFKIAVVAVYSIVIAPNLFAKNKDQATHSDSQATLVSVFCDGKERHGENRLTAWFDKTDKNYLTEDPAFEKMYCSGGFKAKKFNPRLGKWLSSLLYWKYDLHGTFKNKKISGKEFQSSGKNLSTIKLPQSEKTESQADEPSVKTTALDSSQPFDPPTRSSALSEQDSLLRNQGESNPSKLSEGTSAKQIAKLTGIATGAAIVGYSLFKLFEPIYESNHPPRPMDTKAERGRVDENGVPINNVRLSTIGVYSKDDPFPINSGVRMKTYAANAKGFDQKNGKIAVIVEPRPLDILVKVIRHAMASLEDDWRFQVFHGTNNKTFLEAHFSDEIASGKLILTHMHCKNLSVKIYNNLMLDPEFWNQVLGETVLMFEIDSTVCGSESSIEPFLAYDYVGAPWRRAPWFNLLVYEKDGKKFLFIEPFLPLNKRKLTWAGYKFIKKMPVRVGNSGFSVRKRSKMLAILDHYRPRNFHMVNRAYDFYLAGAFLDSGYLIPDKETASSFSFEGVLGDSPPFATHKPWEHLSKDQIKHLESVCPNLSTLREYYQGEKKVRWGC